MEQLNIDDALHLAGFAVLLGSFTVLAATNVVQQVKKRVS